MANDAKQPNDVSRQPLAKRKQTNALPAPVCPAPLVHPPRTIPSRSTLSTATSPTSRRRLHPALRVLIGLCLCGALVLGTLGALLLAGQTELVATLIVGAVLLVVFGTPLMCVVGIIALYVWSMSRVYRRPARTQSPTPPHTPRGKVVIAEIVDD